MIRNIFRWLALTLLAYVGSAIIAKPDLAEVIKGTFVPAFHFDQKFLSLLVAVILLTTAFLFVASAQNGLASTIGQQHAMTGQISAAWNVFASIPLVAALLIGGWLSAGRRAACSIFQSAFS